MSPAPVIAFWHDECLLARHGRRAVRGRAVGADRGPGAAPGERRALRTCARRSTRLLGRRRRVARGAARDRRRAAARSTRRSTSPRSRRSRGVDGVVHVEGSTFASAATPRAARRAAGAALAAADAAAARGGAGRLRVRASARPSRGSGPIDGYCFYTNTALAAQRLRDRGAARVAVVDWDVHHGNGTQACFWERRRRPRHQHPHGPPRVGRTTTGRTASRPSAARAPAWARRSTCRCRSAPATARTPTRWTEVVVPALRGVRARGARLRAGDGRRASSTRTAGCASRPAGLPRHRGPRAAMRRDDARDRVARRHAGGRLRPHVRRRS